MSEKSADYCIVLAGHGSRDIDGLHEFEALVELVRARAGSRLVARAFLEFAQPPIGDVVAACLSEGYQTVVVVPCLLAAATHAKNDMPSQLFELRARFPQASIHFGAAMDLHPRLLQLSQERILETESRSAQVVARGDTCLVVVGRGTSDPDANSDIAKLARLLEEGMGFGTSFVCYSGTAKPLVTEGLRAAATLGYRRLLVFPYMLFDGVLVKRIYAAANAVQERYAELEVLKAPYLGVHPNVADVFLERAREGLEGRAHMNCSLCQYRVQMVGFEGQVGTPQSTHHPAFTAAIPEMSVAPETISPTPRWHPYVPPPLEEESFEMMARALDWSTYPASVVPVLQWIAHTAGDYSTVEELFFSPGVVETGIRALLRCRRVVTDVPMIASGLKGPLIEQLGVRVWCGRDEREAELSARHFQLTTAAAGIRMAWQSFGNDVLLAIGEAPTAVTEALRLIQEHGWRPQLVIGLPAGFVGAAEVKQELKRCLSIPRITNTGTRGGCPWVAAVLNALLIQAVKALAEREDEVVNA
jgi:precorrin-8X/cobalt-precorrin-8 methylmutase